MITRTPSHFIPSPGSAHTPCARVSGRHAFGADFPESDFGLVFDIAPQVVLAHGEDRKQLEPSLVREGILRKSTVKMRKSDVFDDIIRWFCGSCRHTTSQSNIAF